MSKPKNKDTLIGRTIVDVQTVNTTAGNVPCLYLDDGTQVYVLSDSEGNEPGCLYVYGKARIAKLIGGRSCLGF